MSGTSTRRFVREQPISEDEEVRSVVELTRDGPHLRRVRRETKGGRVRAPRASGRTFASPEAAARALDEEAAALRDDGYAEDDPIEPAPPIPPREIAAARAAFAARQARAEAASLEVARAWVGRGYDLARSFVDQCKGMPRGTHPADLAAECAALAERAFGIQFERRTRDLDGETSGPRRVPARRLHEHFMSPLHVIALAERNLLRGAVSDDADVSARVGQLHRALLGATA